MEIQNSKNVQLFYIPNAKEAFDPDDAHGFGAFEENALSLADAEDSTLDLMEALDND